MQISCVGQGRGWANLRWRVGSATVNWERFSNSYESIFIPRWRDGCVSLQGVLPSSLWHHSCWLSISAGPSCYSQGPRNPQSFYLYFPSCQGLLSLDFCLLASHSCFAKAAICFLPPTRKKPGRDLRRPPQVLASGVCALCCHWDLSQEHLKRVISGILETWGERQE